MNDKLSDVSAVDDRRTLQVLKNHGSKITIALDIPDGQRRHWLKVSKKMCEGARAKAGGVVRHHTDCTQRLDPLDYVRQTLRDSRASNQQCLRSACGREATRLLLRSVWNLQQELGRAQSSGLEESADCVSDRYIIGSLFLFSCKGINAANGYCHVGMNTTIITDSKWNT